MSVISSVFQSTHPVRGATRGPRRPNRRRKISIHAPRAGCDEFYAIFDTVKLKFQSTHPVRGATCNRRYCQLQLYDFNPRTPCGVRLRTLVVCHRMMDISIHAPRAGCDGRAHGARDFASKHFNPRTPCGVRPKGYVYLTVTGLFQSTHPVRGATSSHALQTMTLCGFQSTHPVRGATK